MVESQELGEEVRRLRKQENLTQPAIVTRVRTLGVGQKLSVPHLSGIETGKELPSWQLAHVLDTVLNSWPAITKLLITAKIPTARRLFDELEVTGAESDQLGKIKTLLARGRLPEARESAESFVAQAASLRELVDALTILADVEWTTSQRASAAERYFQATNAAYLGKSEKLVVDSLEHLVCRQSIAEDYESAVTVLHEWLDRLPESAGLWRRLGHLEWYAGHFRLAYAALSTALSLGYPRLRILHARGQVLAEWDRPDEAVVELTEVLTDSLTLMSEAYARSSLGYAFASLHQPERAAYEFKQSEELRPRNAWLHYYMGKWYHQNGREEEAIGSFRRSLTLDSPPLNRHKREYVVKELSRMGESAEPM